MKTKHNKDYTLPVIVVGGLFVLMLLVTAATMPEQKIEKCPNVNVVAKTNNLAPKAYAGTPHIFAIDQKIINKVLVLSAVLEQPGFIVAYKIISNESQYSEEVLGATKLLQPGLYSNREVVLSGSVYSGEEIFVVVYEDNGDGVFVVREEKVENSDTPTSETSFLAL